MALWLKDTFLDTIGFGADSSPPAPTSHRKRRASSDGGRGRSRTRRHSVKMYRSAPYPSSPWPSSSAGFRKESRASPAKEEPRVVPTAEKPVPYSDDDSVSSSSSYLPAGFTAGSPAFKSIVPRIDSTQTPPTPLKRDATTTSHPPIAITAYEAATVPVATPAQTAASPVKKSRTEGKKEKDAWTTEPNTRARKVASRNPDPAYAVQHEVKEPEYALRDIEIRDGIAHLRALMASFSAHFFSFGLAPETVLSASFFAKFRAETAKIIGCVASGGPGGVDGWKDMFREEGKRRALVCAVIGNVVTEQVFQHLFFGGIQKHVMGVVKLQEQYKDEDGFDRNTHYAEYVRSILNTHDTGTLDLPSNFTDHVSYIVGVLYTHLAPIASLDRTFDTRSMLPGLHEIVTHAGLLSLAMRVDPHTVYHFEPVFKEDTFSSKRMQCLNQKEMEQMNPTTDDKHDLLTENEKARRAGLSSLEKKRGKNDDPLTQVIIMDGVTAFRRGGWESADSTILDVRFEEAEFQESGVRARMLVPGWVFCRWGRAREFKDGKSADLAKVHGAAWNGGFKEFADVEGVADWMGIERAERERKTKAV